MAAYSPSRRRRAQPGADVHFGQCSLDCAWADAPGRCVSVRFRRSRSSSPQSVRVRARSNEGRRTAAVWVCGCGCGRVRACARARGASERTAVLDLSGISGTRAAFLSPRPLGPVHALPFLACKALAPWGRASRPGIPILPASRARVERSAPSERVSSDRPAACGACGGGGRKRGQAGVDEWTMVSPPKRGPRRATFLGPKRDSGRRRCTLHAARCTRISEPGNPGPNGGAHDARPTTHDARRALARPEGDPRSAARDMPPDEE